MNWYIVSCIIFFIIGVFGAIKASDYPYATKLKGWMIDTLIVLGFAGFVITCLIFVITQLG